MAYKLVALDIDGTLLSSRHELLPSTLRAIRLAQDRGVLVTLATGRAFPLARPIARRLSLSAPLVTHDGAYVASHHDNRVLVAKRISRACTAEIIDTAVRLGLDVMLQHESYALTTRRLSWKDWISQRCWSSVVHFLAARYPVRRVTAEELAAHVQREEVSPPKLFVTGPPDRLASFKEAVESRFLSLVRVTSSGEDNLEIIPHGVSKASGLAVLAETLKIHPAEMIAIGDQFNDLEMIRFAGLGVAMGNAPDSVQREADFVTRTNDDDGVAYVIRRFVLEEEELLNHGPFSGMTT